MITSEVIRIRQQIEEECKAAKFGLYGMAETASHAFISARYKRLGVLHDQLKNHVGDDEATTLLAAIHNQVMGSGNTL